MDLFSRKAEVRGRIALSNRPAETHFLLSALFVATAPGAPPPMTGLPSMELLERWPHGEPVEATGARLGDIGEEFTARLPAGDYQVLVTALPFVIEGSRLVQDPNNRFGFWPVPKAVRLEAGQTRHLSLRVAFPAGLGRFGERESSVPLMRRIGAANARRYAESAELANTERFREAFEAYGALASSQPVAALLPADANEFRLVLQLGRVKCLLSLNRVDDAAALIRETSDALLQTVRLEQADPMTVWDVRSTMTLVGAHAGPHDTLGELAGDAVGTLGPFFAEDGRAHDTAVHMANGLVREVSRVLRGASRWDTLVTVLEAIHITTSQLNAPEVQFVALGHRLEALLRTDRMDEANKLLEARRQQGGTELLADIAEGEELSAALRFLRRG